ncbi:hypothetical protein ACA910_009836 [Epithemia clementina (nom. ined.)]
MITLSVVEFGQLHMLMLLKHFYFPLISRFAKLQDTPPLGMSIEEIEVLIIEDSLTPLVGSVARPRYANHSATALRELTRGALPAGNPIVILTSFPFNLPRILSSDSGFKFHFLTRFKFPNLTPEQLAHIFLQKLTQASLVSTKGVMVDYLVESIASNTKPKWHLECNGNIANLLLTGVRLELHSSQITSVG